MPLNPAAAMIYVALTRGLNTPWVTNGASLRTEWIFVTEPAMGQPDHAVIKRRERIAFLLLTAVVFPLLTVMFVAGYGFLVWIYQMFAGPPTGH
jgi:nitrate reductase NapE